MSEFQPVATLLDLEVLNDAEVLSGYLYGVHGNHEPPANTFTRSWWHGFRNGAVDGGHAIKDAAQAALAHQYATAQACSDTVMGDHDFFRLPIQ